MKSALSSITISPENLYPVTFLNNLLGAENQALILQAGSKLAHINKDSEQYDSLLRNANSYESLVFSGQAINLYTLEKIYRKYFEKASCSLLISKHPLHLAFSSQVFAITILYDSQQKLDISKTSLDIAKHFFIDCIKVSKVKVSQPGVLVMDMDSTIIDMECIDEIAALNNLGDKVSEITEMAMQGKLDFNQSLISRVGCLRGIEISQLEALRSRLPINPGFSSTIQYLQQRNWITCIASGGFTYFANYLKDTFNLTHATSNTLSIDNQKLTGEVEGKIVNGEVKKEVLLSCLSEHGIPPEQSIAIGDGANDLVMMEAAELGVAYKAKQKVQLAADANILYCGFEGLLYALEFDEAR